MAKNTLNFEDRSLRVRLNAFMAVSMAVLYILYCFVLVPLAIMYSNDVVYSSTVLPTVIEVIYDIVEIMAISVGYAVCIYAVYRYGISSIIPSAVIFLCVTLFKYISNVAMDWINIGFEPDEIWSDLSVVALPFLLEMLQFFVMLFIVNKVMAGYGAWASERKKALQRAGAEVPEDIGAYPFNGILNMQNPMVKTSVYSGLVIICTSLIQSVPYFVLVTVNYGEFPAAWLISLVLTVCVEGVVCYFTVIALIMLFFEKKFKRELYKV